MLHLSATLSQVLPAVALAMSVFVFVLCADNLIMLHLEAYLVTLFERTTKPMALSAADQAIVDAIISELKAEVSANEGAAEAFIVKNGDAFVNSAEARILAVLPKNGIVANFIDAYATNLVKNAASAAIAAMPKNAATIVAFAEAEIVNALNTVAAGV